MKNALFALVALPGAALLLSSCITPEAEMRFRFPAVELAGRHRNELKVEDVARIVELARQRTDIRKPVYQIDAEFADIAHVRSGRPDKVGDFFTSFDVRKRNGRWDIIESSVHTGPVAVITS